VSFTVDTYPHEVFAGTVGQVRYNATMTQNVVTYTVVVHVPNYNFKLLPYLTANLQFRVAERSDALLVPNAALRWRPRPEQVAPEFRSEYEQSRRRRASSVESTPGSADFHHSRAIVWVESEGFVRPIKIRTGVTDGSATEVAADLEGELSPGTPLVVGQNQSEGPGGTVNPFAPKVYGNKKE
jgi:HlyD family secretion protein